MNTLDTPLDLLHDLTAQVPPALEQLTTTAAPLIDAAVTSAVEAAQSVRPSPNRPSPNRRRMVIGSAIVVGVVGLTLIYRRRAAATRSPNEAISPGQPDGDLTSG